MFMSADSSRCTISNSLFNNKKYHLWLCRRWSCIFSCSGNVFIFFIFWTNLCINWSIYCNDIRNDNWRYCDIWGYLCNCNNSIWTRLGNLFTWNRTLFWQQTLQSFCVCVCVSWKINLRSAYVAYRGAKEKDSRFFSCFLVFYLLFRDTNEGGNCVQSINNDTCIVENMCSFRNFEAWMTMVHFTMGEFDVRKQSLFYWIISVWFF